MTTRISEITARLEAATTVLIDSEGGLRLCEATEPMAEIVLTVSERNEIVAALSAAQEREGKLREALKEALAVHGGDIRFGHDEDEHSWCTKARALLSQPTQEVKP